MPISHLLFLKSHSKMYKANYPMIMLFPPSNSLNGTFVFEQNPVKLKSQVYYTQA